MENFAVMAMAIRERTGYLYGIKKKTFYFDGVFLVLI